MNERPEWADDEARALRALSALRRVIFKYPIAVQAAFGALASEGRRFAETPEGAVWRSRLIEARATGRARMVWEVLSLGAFRELSEEPLPNVFADVLAQVVSERPLEPLLARLFEGRG